MKLAEWLYQNSMTPSLLRRKLDVQDRATIHRLLSGERKPGLAMAQRIMDLTKGAVQPADFLDPTPPKCARYVVEEDGTVRTVLPWSPLWENASPSPDGLAEPPPEPAPPGPKLAAPISRALDVLGGRAKFTSAGTFLLDGRVTDIRGVVKAANAVLRGRGSATIPYPGVEPLDD